jgi:hypothetical protein
VFCRAQANCVGVGLPLGFHTVYGLNPSARPDVVSGILVLGPTCCPVFYFSIAWTALICYRTQAQLDRGLQVIFNPIYKFPAKYARVAQYIYEKLEAERWGADEVGAEDAVEDDILDAGGSDETASTAANVERKNSGPLRDSDFPADNDPIYGVDSIMHYILRIRGPKTASYQINPSFKSKNAKVFGHNGLTVGDCWPNQMALLRDGAHGQLSGPCFYTSSY